MEARAVKLSGTLVLALGMALLAPSGALAHCDTIDGPVAKDARTALAKRDITAALKWIKPKSEAEARKAFGKALAVRAGGPDARELADTYFMETLIRLHRAGEGAPFTGLKPAGAVEPPIAAADKAIASGSVEALARSTAEHAAAGVRERFARVVATRRHADDSVAAGRQYVAAYVDFVHYVERLHASPAHGGETDVEAAENSPAGGHAH